MRVSIRIFCLFLILVIWSFESNATSHDFIKNNGQWEDPILFEMRSNEGTIRILQHSFEFHMFDQAKAFELHEKGIINQPVDAHFWKVDFINANDVDPIVLVSSGTLYHFYVGNDRSKWRSEVQSAKSILFPNFYDNIDLKIFSTGESFKYEFIVHPKGDPKVIRWQYVGIEPILKNNGDLAFETEWKTYIEDATYTYQLNSENDHNEIESCFSRTIDSVFTFNVGEYDPERDLIIDPGVLISTLFPSVSSQNGGVAEHPEGGYLASVHSWTEEYTATPGKYQSFYTATILIVKYNETLTQIDWIAQLGGTGNNGTREMQVSSTEIVLTGRTNSADYPVTPGSFDGQIGGIWDIFVSILSLDGSELEASALFGSESEDQEGGSIWLRYNQVDNYNPSPRRDVIKCQTVGEKRYVAFRCDPNIGYEGGIFFGNSANSSEAIGLFCFDLDLSQLHWYTVLASEQEQTDSDDPDSWFNSIYDLQILSNGKLLMIGASNASGLPITENTIQGVRNGLSDAWMAVVEPEDGSIIHASYFGTDQKDDALLAMADSDSTFIVTGRTEGEMPVSPGAIDEGSGRIWLARIKNDLSEITTLGAIGENAPTLGMFLINGLNVDACGSITFVLHGRQSNSGIGYVYSNMPITEPSDTDAGSFYVCALDNELSEILSSFYLGGQVISGFAGFGKNGTYLHHTYSDVYFQSNPAYTLHTTPGALQEDQIASVQASLSIVELTPPPLISQIQHNEGSVCLPYQIQLSAIGNAESYLWDLGDGSLISGSEIEHEFIESGTYSAKLIVSSTQTCNSVDTIHFELNIPEPPPSPVADFDVLNFEPCEQEQSVDLSFNGNPGTYMQWELPDGSVIENTLQTNFEIHSAGSFDVFLVVEDSICGLADSLHQTLVVHDPLIVNWSEPAFDPCLSEQIIELELSASGQEEIYWTLPDGGSIQNAQQISYLIDSPGDYLFELEVIDTNCDQSQSFSFVANVQGPLDASWEYVLPDPCSGEPIFASFTGQGADQLTWTLPDSSQILEANEIEAGTMTGQSQSLMLWAQSQQCGQDSLLVVEFSTGTPLNISVTNDLIQDDPCHEGVFMAEVQGSGFDSILWTDEFGNSSDQSSFSQAYPTGTETTVNLTVNNPDCAQVYSEDFEITVSSSEPLTNFEIPNVFSPQKDGVNDTYRIPELADLNPEDVISFKIFNRWGGLVLEQYGVLPHWDGTFQGEEAASGVYFFTLEVYDNCSGENYRRSGEIQLLR